MLIGKLVRKVFKQRFYERLRTYFQYSPFGYAAKWNELERIRRISLEHVDKSIEKYRPGLSEEERAELKRDICEASQKFHIRASEYFMYRFYEKTDDERAEFLSEGERCLLKNKVNSWFQWRVFNDKARTAKVFAPYFRRVWAEFALPDDNAKFEEFLKEHPSVIVKPMDSCGGKGVRKLIFDENVDLHKTVEELSAFYCSLYIRNSRMAKIVVEDLIVQDERMSRFHPQSVNTLRLITFRMKDRTVIFHPFFRIGCGDSIVDNGAAGGIFCVLDPETGVSLSAANEMAQFFTEHPDTGVPLIGFKVPMYEEAVELAKKMADVVPSCPYVGWDLALAKDGWILVEANASPQFLTQIGLQQGLKKEFYAIVRELGVKC